MTEQSSAYAPVPGAPSAGAPWASMPPQHPPVANGVHVVVFKGGWAALGSGMNQVKRVETALREINARGLAVAAAVPDHWSIWRKIGMAFLALFSLGFYVRSPNVILITQPAPLRT